MKKLFAFKLFIIFLFFINISIAQNADKNLKIDSLYHQLKNCSIDTSLASIHREIFNELRYENIDTALWHINQAISLDDENNYYRGLKEDYIKLSAFYVQRFELEKGAEVLNKILELATNENDYKGLAYAYNAQGIIHARQARYDEAISLIIKALEINEREKDFITAADNYNNLGNLHFYMKNFDKAIFQYNKSKELYRQGGNEYGIASGNMNLGLIYSVKNEFNKALNYLTPAADFFARNNRLPELALCYSNISEVYIQTGRYNLALEYADKNLEIAYKIKDNGALLNAWYHKASINYAANNFDSARCDYLKIIELAKEINSPNDILNSYLSLAKTDSLQNNYLSALNYYIKYFNIKDSISGVEKSRKLEELQNKYDYEKTVVENELLKKENLFHKNFTLTVGIFSGLILILIILIIRSNIQKTKAYKILQAQQTKIIEQNESLVEQSRKIATQNQAIESQNSELKLLSIVAQKTDNAITIFDKNGNIDWLNPGFERIYGYTQKQYFEKEGRNIYENSDVEFRKKFMLCVNNMQTVIFESKAKANNEIVIWRQITLSPVVEKGEISKVVAVESDITQLKKAEKQILIQNANITSSIKYALTLQKAILPPLDQLKNFFSDSFILSLPKDIVSGDFCWFTEIAENKYIIAVVDCTGHGVPGAFMSIIGSRLLSEIIIGRQIFSPKEILNCLVEEIQLALKQSITGNSDGMDVCLCYVEKNEAEIKVVFAGAKRPLIYIANGKLNNIRGTAKLIGGMRLRKQMVEFTNTTIFLQKGDYLFLTSDGYSDQNNPEMIRFGRKRLQQLIAANYNLEMNLQEKMLEKELKKYKRNARQRDDITILAVRL